MPPSPPPLRVGYYLSESKAEKLEWNKFMEIAESEGGLKLIPIDLNKDVESQGPFDMLLHKVTDELVDTENQVSEHKIKNIEEYISKHPGILQIDPVSKQRTVLDRGALSELLRHLNGAMPPALHVRCPNFILVESQPGEGYGELLRRADVKFPVVCKTVQACGSQQSHLMGIVFHEADLVQFKTPLLIQEFINHDAVVFKVFVIGDYINVVRRKSIRNLFDWETDAIFFDSQAPLPAALIEGYCPPSSHPARVPAATAHESKAEPPLDTLKQVSRKISDSLGLTLFGFDVITQVGTGLHGVVDVNYFPGYSGVPDFFQVLLNHIHSLYLAQVVKTA